MTSFCLYGLGVTGKSVINYFHKKNIFYHELNSLHGHDAFLIENEAMAAILSKIFK